MMPNQPRMRVTVTTSSSCPSWSWPFCKIALLQGWPTWHSGHSPVGEMVSFHWSICWGCMPCIEKPVWWCRFAVNKMLLKTILTGMNIFASVKKNGCVSDFPWLTFHHQLIVWDCEPSSLKTWYINNLQYASTFIQVWWPWSSFDMTVASEIWCYALYCLSKV